MLMLEFAMTRAAEGGSYSAGVARILDVIDKSGVPYQLTPMGTILEGEWDECLAVVSACFEALKADGATRVGANLKLDWRAGGERRMASKVEKVEQRLGRKLST